MKTHVSEKGQVTIPKALRRRLGIRPGDVLDFHDERGRLVGEKAVQGDAFDRHYGCLKLDRTTDEIIDEMRGKADPR